MRAGLFVLVSVLAAANLLAGCGAPFVWSGTCGEEHRIDFLDIEQPWPCGGHSAIGSDECTEVGVQCVDPMRYECDGFTVEITESTFTVRSGECVDVHAIERVAL